MSILKVQNLDYNLRKVAAYCQVMTEAKQLERSRLVLVCFVTVSALVLNMVNLDWMVDQESFKIYALFLAVLYLFLSHTVFDSWIDGKKEIAARIQDNFDRSIFGLSKDELPYEASVDDGYVYRKSEKYYKKQSIANVKDWYSIKNENLPVSIQVLLCQKGNTSWDTSLRSLFKVVLISFSMLIVVLAVVFFLINRSSSHSIIMAVSLAVPFLDYLVLVYKKNKESLSVSKSLNNEILSAVNKAKLNATEFELGIYSERIQDKFYNKRKTDIPVPDWVHKIKRKSQHRETGYETSMLEEELEKAFSDGSGG